MPVTTPGAAVILTATHIKGATVGGAAATLLIGVGGLAATLATDGDVPAYRIAAVGGFAALLVIGLIITIIATLRGLAAVIGHQADIEEMAAGHFQEIAEHHRRLEKAAEDHFREISEMIDQRIDQGIQDHLDQIEHLLVKIYELLGRQADVIGDVLEAQIAYRDDELGRRRNHRSG